MSVFKDFPGLENLERKNSRTFKDVQELCRNMTAYHGKLDSSLSLLKKLDLSVVCTSDMLLQHQSTKLSPLGMNKTV